MHAGYYSTGAAVVESQFELYGISRGCETVRHDSRQLVPALGGYFFDAIFNSINRATRHFGRTLEAENFITRAFANFRKIGATWAERRRARPLITRERHTLVAENSRKPVYRLRNRAEISPVFGRPSILLADGGNYIRLPISLVNARRVSPPGAILLPPRRQRRLDVSEPTRRETSGEKRPSDEIGSLDKLPARLFRALPPPRPRFTQ